MDKITNKRTSFSAGATVHLWDNMQLFLDGNSKITCDDGSYEQPVANSFSLPHISTCPGSTPACRSACYVHGLQKYAPDNYAQYVQNERTMHRLLLSGNTLHKSSRRLAEYIKGQCLTRFRWHVSGDVFSLRYADWISEVAWCAPNTKFWIYTRTFGALPALVGNSNLAVNLSIDRDNEEAGRKAYLAFAKDGVRVCYMTTGSGDYLPQWLPEGSVVFPDYPLRGRDLKEPTELPWWRSLPHSQRVMVCPADFFGQSQEHRCGPCTKCLKPTPNRLR